MSERGLLSERGLGLFLRGNWCSNPGYGDPSGLDLGEKLADQLILNLKAPDRG